MRCGFLNIVMPILSLMGEYGAVWIILSIVLIAFKKTRACGVAVLLSMIIVFGTGELLIKNVVCRVRPCYYPECNYIEMLIQKPFGYSFPSGHTGSSFAAATALFYYHKKSGAVALAVAAFVGFSRLYNFVHFPTDVLCGMILGIIGGLAVCVILRKSGAENKINSIGSKKAC